MKEKEENVRRSGQNTSLDGFVNVLEKKTEGEKEPSLKGVKCQSIKRRKKADKKKKKKGGKEEIFGKTKSWRLKKGMESQKGGMGLWRGKRRKKSTTKGKKRKACNRQKIKITPERCSRGWWEGGVKTTNRWGRPNCPRWKKGTAKGKKSKKEMIRGAVSIEKVLQEGG